MHTALLSLGSNLDPERHLRAAAAALRERFGEVVFSSVLRTPAVGFEGPEFFNAAAVLRTDLDPAALEAQQAWSGAWCESGRRDHREEKGRSVTVVALARSPPSQTSTLALVAGVHGEKKA